MKSKPRNEPFYLIEGVNAFLQKGLWAVNEALYMIAGWPKSNLFISYMQLPEDIKAHRSYFYLPDGSHSFEPHKLSKMHGEVFLKLKNSIDSFRLWSRRIDLYEGISYLLRPIDVILWATTEGYILSNDIQEALGVFQMSNQKFTKPLQRKVIIKATGQYLLSIDSEQNVTHLCKNPLVVWAQTHSFYNGSDNDGNIFLKKLLERSRIMKSYKENRDMKVPSLVRNAMNELYEVPGIPGRKSNAVLTNKTARRYTLKPIYEIIEKNNVGVIRYNIPLFNVLIKALVEIIVDGNYEDICKKNTPGYSYDAFNEKIMSDRTVQLYLHEAPQIILELTKVAIKHAWHDFQNAQLWKTAAVDALRLEERKRK